jgi:hypothetical protein
MHAYTAWHVGMHSASRAGACNSSSPMQLTLAHQIRCCEKPDPWGSSVRSNDTPYNTSTALWPHAWAVLQRQRKADAKQT